MFLISTTKVQKSIDICKFFMLICINIILLYVNTYTALCVAGSCITLMERNRGLTPPVSSCRLLSDC